MENKKGTGIFLGVVAVATLIVAIIGATFAYFSISAASDEAAVNLTAYEFNASLSVSQVYPATGVTSQALIPLNPTTSINGTTNLLYAVNAATNRCVDDKGFQVCALYRVELVNNGSQDLTFNGSLKTVTNTASTSTGRVNPTAFTDLKYQEMTGELDSLALSGDAVGIASTEGETATIPTVTATAGQTVTKYIAVYLGDTGEDQSAQMGASFTGQIIYTSTSGSNSQLTGTFNVQP